MPKNLTQIDLDTESADFPAPGSTEEERRFRILQKQLEHQFRVIFPDQHLPRTVVVVPSISLDHQVLEKIAGAPFYEERLLCLLMLLRMPRTRVIYVTSEPIHATIIDYYLHLLPGVPESHARKRLLQFSCHDSSSKPLTQKILGRPRLMRRILEHIPAPESGHITCFNASPLERTLSVRLGLPLYACDPALVHFGDKSHGREVMRDAGVPIPSGYEHLRDEKDMGDSLYALKRENPSLKRAVVKLNEGFSGEGNAIFEFEGAPKGMGQQAWIHEILPARLKFEAKRERWDPFAEKYREMGGIVECFLEGAVKASPNARYRINPAGQVEVISTQDQLLGGPSGQIYLACRFPAEEGYRREIQGMGMDITNKLRDRGVLGQVGIDFICFKKGERWEKYGIEVNIRKGGATHPFLMLQFLTDGQYDPESASYRTPSGEPRCYLASDNLEKELYQGLAPDDLIDIAVENSIHFHGATQQGTVFHLIGALSRFGKLGLVCIDRTIAGAQKRYEDTMAILDREARRYGSGEAP